MRHALVALALASSACAGVYAELAGTANASAAAVTFSVGADFDVGRKGRVAAGYEGDGALHGAAVRGDVSVLDMGDDLKLRAGAAVGVDAQGGLLGYGGAGAAWYFAPRHSAHLLLGADYRGQLGGTARLAYVFAFGDTRPDSIVLFPTAARANIVFSIGETARRRGCGVRDDHTPTAPSAAVSCDLDRPMLFQQVEGGLVVMCKHRGEEDCREQADGLLDETRERIKERDSK